MERGIFFLPIQATIKNSPTTTNKLATIPEVFKGAILKELSVLLLVSEDRLGSAKGLLFWGNCKPALAGCLARSACSGSICLF